MKTTKEGNLKPVESPSSSPLHQLWQERHEEKALTYDQRRAVLNHFIDRVDQMLTEASFQFGGGLRGNSQQWDDGPEPQEFLELLHPWIKDYKRRISAVLPQEMSGDLDRCDLDAQFFALVTMGQKTAYQLGILAGARLAGYPEAKLREMAEYLVDRCDEALPCRLW